MIKDKVGLFASGPPKAFAKSSLLSSPLPCGGEGEGGLRKIFDYEASCKTHHMTTIAILSVANNLVFQDG
jgi:hypothetical protein